MVNKLADQYECPVDIHIFKFIDTQLELYHMLGFSPNMITTLSIIFGLLAGYEIFQGNFFIAALFWLIGYYFDCVDGKLARQYNMVSVFGDLYDHIGDAFKYFFVLYALFYSSNKKTTDKQWFYMTLILIIMIFQFIHMGYQEKVYDKKEESGYLNICKIFTAWDNDHHRTIQYTKYFGCGTWNLCFALMIFFWRK